MSNEEILIRRYFLRYLARSEALMPRCITTTTASL
jgi:hypothetical protein